IAFSTDFLPESRLVTCECEAVPVRDALERILAGTDLQYQEMRAHVLIEPAYRQEPPVLASVSSSPVTWPAPQLTTLSLWRAAPLAVEDFQAGTVAGTVVDAKTARPLPDAVIVVEGTTTGARTSVRGEFRLTGLTGSTARLRVTRIGYQPGTQ